VRSVGRLISVLIVEGVVDRDILFTG
jgi:hypothetical protein